MDILSSSTWTWPGRAEGEVQKIAWANGLTKLTIFSTSQKLIAPQDYIIGTFKGTSRVKYRNSSQSLKSLKEWSVLQMIIEVQQILARLNVVLFLVVAYQHCDR